MADSEMTEHVSTSQMERFCVRAIPVGQLSAIAVHLNECADCHQQLVATLGRQRGTAPVTFTLAPEFWLRHQHTDYEQLVELAEGKLDTTDREMIDIHLKVCLSCREDVRSFLAFREQIALEMDVSYFPVRHEPVRQRFSFVTWWRSLAWKPIYAAAIVVIGIALVIGFARLLKQRSENFQARQTPTPQVSPGTTGQTPTPNNLAAKDPSPPATPKEPPGEKPNSTAAIIALNDGAGMVTVDKGGNVSGLDEVPAPTRDEIASVLLSERIERPAILKDLAGQESNLRGSNNKQPFRLISPERNVIPSDRPIFKWDKLSGASTYRVYVNNPSGHEIARSEELASEQTEWVVPKPLNRGENYAWTVMAVVDGKEVVSPGPTSPEMRFQVLSTSRLQQLNELKKTRSHLALGVFYAREGMIAEAESEFQALVRDNPRSQHAKKLHREIQSWRRR